MARVAAILLLTLGLSACSLMSAQDDKARLLEFQRLYMKQGLACDAPYFAMFKATASGERVDGSAAASNAAKVCKDAASLLASFGKLPGSHGSNQSPVEHPCVLSLTAASQAAQQAITLIDGDMRPSLKANFRSLVDDRNRYLKACEADLATRAKTLKIPQSELENIAKQERLAAAGFEGQQELNVQEGARRAH